MRRTRLEERRRSLTTEVAFAPPGSNDVKLIVTYGFDRDLRVREAFCAGFRAETGICAMANDAMVLYSRLLQLGESAEDLAKSMSENRAEGTQSGPPASMIGAILRGAVQIEREIREND